MNEAVAWWGARSRREQLLLAVLAGVALVALLLVLVVKPLQAARGQALADIRTYQTLAGRLRAAGPSAAATVPQRTGPPAAIVAATLAEAGLAADGVAPTATGVAVTASAASYDAALRWIAATEATSALRLRALSIGPGRASGLVTLRAEFG